MTHAKQALLIIDMQRGFMNEHTQVIINNIQELCLDNKFDFVVATRFIQHSDSQFDLALHWNEMPSGSRNTEFVDGIVTHADMVMEKVTYGLSTGDITFFRRMRITDITLCGVDTDACVMACAFDLFDAGFNVHIAAHACASSGGPELHESGLLMLRRNIDPTI